MFPISSILWPSDGSGSSLKALQAAVEIAERFNADIYALRVVDQVPPLVEGSGYAPMAIKNFDVPLYQQELLNTAANELNKAVSDNVPQEIKVVAEVKIGVPSEVINAFAQEKNIDLIVMATQGRTGLSRFMVGSVAEKTIRQSIKPMLIIPARSDDR